MGPFLQKLCVFLENGIKEMNGNDDGHFLFLSSPQLTLHLPHHRCLLDDRVVLSGPRLAGGSAAFSDANKKRSKSKEKRSILESSQAQRA